MVRLRLLLVGTCAAACCVGQAEITEKTTLESYFSSNRMHRGLFHYLSWGETNLRFNDHISATLSGMTFGGANSYDEACISFEKDDKILRLGRIRTAFGFSNWSELFYNGFNHIPLVRIAPLANKLGLTRDDAGAELTWGSPTLQVQAAVVDTKLSPTQVAPKRADHASVRIQTNQGDFIVAGDALVSLRGTGNIFGLDLRWTAPRLVVRGELMAGNGATQSSWGYYVDAAYRIPKLTRTQAVARVEGVRYGSTFLSSSGSEGTVLTTVGIRQIVSPNLSVNLNYGWGSGESSGYVANSGLKGWTLRTMFQIHL